MAKKYDNPKDFLIIEMSYEEAVSVDFGGEFEGKHIIVCDTCNQLFNEDDNIYYVACINRALDKECCDDFIGNADRYEEDIPYEIKHYNYYAEKLKLDKV